MSRPRVTGFLDPRSWQRRELVDPDAPATGRQLARLNRERRLELVPAGSATPISKAEAAFAIDAGKTPAEGSSDDPVF